MQKEIKGLYTIYGMWLFFGIIGMIFISFNIPRALQENDTVGIVFSIVFGIIFLAMILGFGHLIRVAPKKVQEKYQDIFNHYPELEENVELFKENATAVDKLNQLYLYREAIFNTQYGRFVNPIFLNEIQALGVRIKWVRNGKVRSKNLFLLSREGEKEFEFDLGMVTPPKYEQLILFLHAVVDVKPDLEFFNEVEDWSKKQALERLVFVFQNFLKGTFNFLSTFKNQNLYVFYWIDWLELVLHKIVRLKSHFDIIIKT